ncbi:rifin PIR protein,putative [Plasmodium sp. DRC-Itaito]|nr:rifin PIR protein,putative [Plasmodium sp. DRC-Itaito]
MKVHYINILLFAHALNILANYKNNPSITPHTPKIPITRLLCECELYAPANYENDPQMKEVMQQFEDRTTQRFHEYDERMKRTRQKCKEQCNKDIQKIILKDKLEKQMTQHFATLDTDIPSDAIPTCICEKSIADKIEKGCLRCAQNLGGIVVPSSGVIGEIGAFAVYAWKNAALETAIKAALEANTTNIAIASRAAGEVMGVKTVIAELRALKVDELIPGISNSIGNAIPYNDVTKIFNVIYDEYGGTCSLSSTGSTICRDINIKFNIRSPADGILDGLPSPMAIRTKVGEVVTKATEAAKAEVAKVTTTETLAIKAAEKEAIDAAFTPYYTTIVASIIAIVVIILIMVIIYLILRHRRKKKMKKKLQYIKLLEE